jgi:hypothetical protein
MKRPLVLVALVIAALSLASTASANDLKFTAELTGAQERPTPVQTEGEGEAKFESDGTSVAFELKWKNLSSPAFAAHIHCGGPEEAGPVGVTLFAGTMGTEGRSRAASPRRTRATPATGTTWPMCWRPWPPAGPMSTSTAPNTGEARSGDR